MPPAGLTGQVLALRRFCHGQVESSKSSKYRRCAVYTPRNTAALRPPNFQLNSELAFTEHTLTTYRYTGLSGAWWQSGKKRPRPLEKSRWIPKSRPQVAYKAPKGFDAIKLHARARQNA